MLIEHLGKVCNTGNGQILNSSHDLVYLKTLCARWEYILDEKNQSITEHHTHPYFDLGGNYLNRLPTGMVLGGERNVTNLNETH